MTRQTHAMTQAGSHAPNEGRIQGSGTEPAERRDDLVSATVPALARHPIDTPAMKWVVRGAGRAKGIGVPVYVLARTRAGALNAAREVRKLLGQPVADELHAAEYRPELDPSLRRWVVQMPPATECERKRREGC